MKDDNFQRTPPAIPDHEIIRQIGSGSYGEVWLARNIMGVYRAVKIVRRRSFQDDRPFEREYNGIKRFEPISRLHHSQVDILHLGVRDADLFYYVMEVADDIESGQEIDPAHYIPKTLDAVLKRDQKLSVDATVNLALTLVTALENLHSHGLVHRDIKPANIIYVHGVAKLADIGLVSAVDGARSLVGTEGFLPPEGPGSPQGDIFSLGKTLYEACTGRDRKDWPELPTLLADLPERKELLELNAIVVRACRDNPGERYQSAEEMRSDLLLMQSGKSVIRLRTVERRLSLVRKGALASVGLLTLLTAAYLHQRQQTGLISRLAEEKVLALDTAKESLYLAHIRIAQQQWEKGEIRSMSNLLQQHIPAKDEKDRRGWEWYYLQSLPHSYLHNIVADRKKVHSISSSPDRKLLATGGGEGIVRIWDAENGTKLAELKGHEKTIYSVAWSPDGRFLASGGNDGKTIIWKTGSFEKLFTLDCEQVAYSVSWSPDGKRIAVGGLGNLPADQDGLITLWNPETGERLRYLATGLGRTWSLAWHPSRNLLAAGENYLGGLLIWDVDVEATPKKINAHDHYISSLAWSPDGAALATASVDQRIRIWNPDTWTFRTIASAHRGACHALEWTEDSRSLISGGADGVIKIWEAETGALNNVIRGHQEMVLTVKSWKLGTQVISGSADGTLRVWKSRIRQESHSIEGMRPVAWSPDGRRFANAIAPREQARGRLQIVEASTLNPLFWIEHPVKSPPFSMAWSPDGKQLAAVFFTANSLHVWDLDSRRETLLRSNVHSTYTRCVAWSPDSTRLVTTGDDGDGVIIWDVKTNIPLVTFRKHAVRIGTAVWNRAGTRIASRDFDGNVYIWDSTTGAVQHHLKPLESRWGSDTPYGVCWAPDDNSLAAVNFDGSISVWNTINGTLARKLIGHSSVARSVDWSPDGRRLASGAEDRTARIWDPVTGLEMLVLSAAENRFPSVSWSPSGKTLAVSHSETLLFDASRAYESDKPAN